MGLDENPVDLFEIDDPGLVPDRLDKRAQRQVPCPTQEAVAGSDHKRQAFRGERVVTESGPIQLIEDERLNGFGTQAREHDRVGDSGSDFLVHREREQLEQRRLAYQDEIVRTRKVLAEQAQFAQAIGWHEMRVVDDRDEHLSGPMDAERFLDQHPFAAVIVPLELNFKSVTQNSQSVMISVQGSVDHRGDHPFRVVGQERLF